MRRNFGSLNLAALDLSAPPDALAHDLADLELADPQQTPHLMGAAADHIVGFPIELFAQAAAESAMLRRRKRSFSDHAPPPHSTTPTMALPVATTTAAATARAQLHHAELHALRCLSLNLMLSSSVPGGRSSVAVTAPQPSTSMPKMVELACQPQSDRTLLGAARRSSLPRNMIQSA